MSRNRDPLPMPVTLVAHHKCLAVAPGSVYRAVITICIAYWIAECPDYLKVDDRLAHLARMPVGQWNQSKAGIFNALNELLPIVKHAHHLASQRKAARIAGNSLAGILGAAARKRKLEMTKNQINENAASINHDNHHPAHKSKIAPQTPQTATPYAPAGSIEPQHAAEIGRATKTAAQSPRPAPGLSDD